MNVEQRFKGEDRDVHHFLSFSSYAKQLAKQNKTCGQWHSQQHKKGRRFSRTNKFSFLSNSASKKQDGTCTKELCRSQDNMPSEKRNALEFNNTGVKYTPAEKVISELQAKKASI